APALVRPPRPPQTAAALRPAAGAGRRAAVLGGAEGVAQHVQRGPSRGGGARPRPGPPAIRGRAQVDRRHRLVGGRRQQRSAPAVRPARAAIVGALRVDRHRSRLVAAPDQAATV
ncbi:MAG: DNA_ligase_IV_Ku-like, partial [uncultured Nocardioidaceae bacterium]